MLLELLLVLTTVICAFQAIRATRLLTAAIWLASVSVLLAIGLFQLGAEETAVIELSVGAGLVTVLFVFAIATSGAEAMRVSYVVPRLLGWVVILGIVGLLGWLITPIQPTTSPIAEPSFAVMLWQERGIDVLVQIGLIFAGIIGVLGLLSEPTIKQGEIITPEKIDTKMRERMPT